MTSREAYKNLLIELNKVNASPILLDDFNYLINKAIIQVANKRYNIYDTSQQVADDLRVLKSTAFLKKEEKDFNAIDDITAYGLTGTSYVVHFPLDYFHLLNCICVFKIKGNSVNCKKDGELVQFAAKRVTSDSWPVINSNYYFRPRPEQPYYFIHNINTSTELPTNKIEVENLTRDTDGTDTSIPSTFTFNGQEISTKKKQQEVRYGNYSSIRCEIRCGSDTSKYEPVGVVIDYLKVPKYVKLTQDELDMVEDNSQVLEFPEPLCFEIMNELVHLAMENIAEPRLQTHIPVTASVASPVQQSTKK